MFGLENLQSLSGIALVLLLGWAWSENRRRFPWKLALGSIAVQAGLVLLLFAVPGARVVLTGVTGAVDGLASATAQGTRFVFGYMGGGDQPYAITNQGALFVFAFQVLPLILVISALSALLWHWKILKWVIRGFGWVFQRTMGLSGTSALAVATNIFLGTVETPLVIRGYLDRLTRSELFMLMTVGLATVAGSTMVAYATLLAPTLRDAAGHVLVASIISAPAGVLLSRIMVPEAEGVTGSETDFGSDLTYDSSVDAISRGIVDGLQVVLNVSATLIVAVGLVALVNVILGAFPAVNGAPLTVERMLGVLMMPLAWSMGIPWRESGQAGLLLGVKAVLTEFVAFIRLAETPAEAISPRSRMILTYALCGFANVASVGIVVSGLGVLMPARRKEVLDLSWKSLYAGFLATIMCGAVVGALSGVIQR